MVKTNREKAIAFLKSSEIGDKEFVKKWISENYTPHYPSIKTGREALLEFYDQLKDMDIKLEIKRIIEDGNYVALHSGYTGPMVVIDIFRFDDGKIVDHWANTQNSVEETVSGHTMLDGSTQIKDLDKTAENKTLLKELVEDVFIVRDYNKMSSFFDDDNYIQHNPRFVDGLSGLVKGLEEMAKKGMEMKFIKNYMILGEGNFVSSVNEGFYNGEHVSFFDIFRIGNSKFVEHWDVIEPIVPSEKWKNQNGKF
jgi:predicted SnoaL-like aldol condensation-catalyzing enzyme